MMFCNKLVLGIMAFLLPASFLSVRSPAQSSTASLIESVDTKGYRRVVGGIDGAFYFINKGTFQIVTVSEAGLRLRQLKDKNKVQASLGGHHFALVDYNSYRPTTLEIAEVTLHDVAGDLIWRRKAPACNAFVFADAAPVAVGIGGAEGLAQTQLLFLDSGGQTVDSARVDYFTRGRFCGDGSHFFAVSGGAGVLKFSSTGELVARYAHGGDYRVSFDGNWLATIGDTSIQIYRGETLIGSMPIEPFAFRDLLFHTSGESLAVLTRGRLQMLALPRLNELWQYRPTDESISLIGLDAAADFSTIICSGSNSDAGPEERNTKGTVVLLDDSGNLIWSEQVSYSTWATSYPQVSLHRSARLVSILTAESLRIYSY
jgi:hypothetical protein